MTQLLIQDPNLLRLCGFFIVLALMAILERYIPRRNNAPRRKIRWTNNFAMIFLDSLIVRIVLPITSITVALYAEQNQWGLFNLVKLPYAFNLMATLVLLDLLIYGQHFVFHKVPWLWRFHRTHHTDTHIDVSTGIRFHPVEIILSLLIKFAAILLFGIPALAILLFEIILNMTAMITHSNIFLPHRLDKYLRLVFVTPDMHRVHHSVYRDETDSNYGFNLAIWDKFFGTYIAQPRDNHIEMQIGLKGFRQSREAWLDKMLTQPFRNN